MPARLAPARIVRCIGDSPSTGGLARLRARAGAATSSTLQHGIHGLRFSLHRTRVFLAGRLNPSTFLGLHLTIGLIVVAAAIWFFSALVDSVLDNATLVRWDIATDAWIHARVTPGGTGVFHVITRLGSPGAMTVLAIIGAVVLIARGRPTMFVTWVAAFAGGGILDRVLKMLVHRSRPLYATEHLRNVTFSFPSGHAMGSMIGILMLLHALWIFRIVRGPARAIVAVAGAVFVALVGISRVYLGVHYPSDVFGGWAVGAAWMGLCVSIAGIVLHRRGISVTSRAQ